MCASFSAGGCSGSETRPCILPPPHLIEVVLSQELPGAVPAAGPVEQQTQGVQHPHHALRGVPVATHLLQVPHPEALQGLQAGEQQGTLLVVEKTEMGDE